MDDLERHRLRYRLNGWPIYNVDDEVVDVITEPAWEWAALSQEQQATVRQCAVRLQGGAGNLGWDTAFPFVLDDYGIACPHKWTYHEPTWRECSWCHVAEPLPGRVVRVGDRTMRVPDPPPMYLRVSVPLTLIAAMTPSSAPDPIEVVEYRWTGTRYVQA